MTPTQTTPNNRIKIWETSEATHSRNEIANLLNEIVEANHLRIHYTAAKIFDCKEHLSFGNNSNTQISCNLIALGDVTGRIVVFDIDTNKKLLQISQSLHSNSDNSGDGSILTSADSGNVDTISTKYVQGGHQSRINSLQFNINCQKVNQGNQTKNQNDNQQKQKQKQTQEQKTKGKNVNVNWIDCIELYTCSNDQKIFQWNLKGELLHSIDVGDTIPSCIATTNFKVFRKAKGIKLNQINNNQEPFVIVGCSHINVYNLNTKGKGKNKGKSGNMNINKPIANFTGHASQV